MTACVYGMLIKVRTLSNKQKHDRKEAAAAAAAAAESGND